MSDKNFFTLAKQVLWIKPPRDMDKAFYLRLEELEFQETNMFDWMKIAGLGLAACLMVFAYLEIDFKDKDIFTETAVVRIMQDELFYANLDTMIEIEQSDISDEEWDLLISGVDN